VIRAHEAGNDKVRMAELSMALSHRLVELAADGVTDPQELRRLALETFPLVPPPENQSDAPKETALGGHTLRPLQKCPRLPKREQTMDKEKENKRHTHSGSDSRGRKNKRGSYHRGSI
jgi:hypothetical protein